MTFLAKMDIIPFKFDKDIIDIMDLWLQYMEHFDIMNHDICKLPLTF